MEILLLDRYDEGFAQLRNVASQAALDAGEVFRNQLCLEGVQEEAFKGWDKEYDNMQFVDKKVFSDLNQINLWTVVPHSCKKLWEIWKGLNGE